MLMLENKVAVVTGASQSGIGRSHRTDVWQQEGATVVVNYNGSAEERAEESGKR